jgi:hypothetical protein
LDHAKRLAAANEPCQVVMFDAFGRTQTVARHHLPQYQIPQANDQGGSSLFDATVKALVISGLVTAGIAVLGDLVDRVENDLKKESARSKATHKARHRLRQA